MTEDGGVSSNSRIQMGGVWISMLSAPGGGRPDRVGT